MATQTLRDKNQQTLGYIETRPDGTQIIRDKNQQTKGYYDPKHNVTRDKNQKTVGYGNLLTTLL